MTRYKKTIFLLTQCTSMLEFLFGWILGVWMGQQLPLPSVQAHVQQWWNKPAIQNVTQANTDETPSEQETVPLFTGEMPTTA